MIHEDFASEETQSLNHSTKQVEPLYFIIQSLTVNVHTCCSRKLNRYIKIFLFINQGVTFMILSPTCTPAFSAAPPEIHILKNENIHNKNASLSRTCKQPLSIITISILTHLLCKIWSMQSNNFLKRIIYQHFAIWIDNKDTAGTFPCNTPLTNYSWEQYIIILGRKQKPAKCNPKRNISPSY